MPKPQHAGKGMVSWASSGEAATAPAALGKAYTMGQTDRPARACAACNPIDAVLHFAAYVGLTHQLAGPAARAPRPAPTRCRPPAAPPAPRAACTPRSCPCTRGAPRHPPSWRASSRSSRAWRCTGQPARPCTCAQGGVAARQGQQGSEVADLAWVGGGRRAARQGSESSSRTLQHPLVLWKQGAAWCWAFCAALVLGRILLGAPLRRAGPGDTACVYDACSVCLSLVPPSGGTPTCRCPAG